MIRHQRRASSPLRVLLFTNSVAVGGMEEHVRLLAAHLARDTFFVVGVAPGDKAVAGFSAALRSHTDAFATITPDRRAGRWRALSEALRLGRFVRQQHIDVAHLHSTTYDGLWIATIVCWATGVRRVYVTEHLAPYGPTGVMQRIERRLFGALVTRIVAVSEKNRAQRAARFSTPPSRTTVVTNGIDVSRFDDIPTSEVERVRKAYGLVGRVVIGSVVRLEPEKGINDLIDAFAIVAETYPDALLMIVGDGSHRDSLEARADGLGIRTSTVFTGFQSDPRPFLAAMDMFVLPVPAGSASIGLLEAMAVGMPAIITFGTPGEAVEPGVSGWWANPNDPGELAKRILDLVADPAQRASMGAAARDRIDRDFSAARVARQLGSLYLTNEPSSDGDHGALPLAQHL